MKVDKGEGENGIKKRVAEKIGTQIHGLEDERGE